MAHDDVYLPENSDIVSSKTQAQPSDTYKIDLNNGRTGGMIKDAEALTQAIFFMLSIERYQYPIYSYNYGVELADLIGQPRDYVMSEIKRRIEDALLSDDRINSVDGWTFEILNSAILISFIVHSIYGSINISREVNI